MGALSDLKVVEYASFINGPYCAKLLADFGAEVIKVEEPGVGDEARRREPFLGDIPDPEKSGLFFYLNTNKLGVTLNLRTTTGLRIFKELVKQADILVENNRPSLVKELGIDYEALKETNPGLTMTSITPFGQTGPYRDYKSCDLVSYHMSGMASMTPEWVKDPEQEPPLKGPGKQADFITGVTAAWATLCGIFMRNKDGAGHHIDVSEYEAIAGGGTRSILSLVEYGDIIGGFDRRKGAPNPEPPIACKDGYVVWMALEPKHWIKSLEIIGLPELKERLPMAHVVRCSNWKLLPPEFFSWFAERTKKEIVEAFQEKGISCLPVSTPQEVVEEEHWKERGFFAEIEHPEMGRVRFPGVPFKLSKTPGRLDHPAPLLGEHNKEVFCDRLGYSKEDLVKLRDAGII
jgi:crotonobetainyl-CoA:carnitine CoA-transferase CaiB-like acyl-CoA transferase